MDTDTLICVGKKLLDQVSVYISLIEKLNLTDEQWYLNFADKLNEYSVKH